MRKLPKVKKAWAKVYRMAMSNLRHSTTPVSDYYYKYGGMCAAVGYVGPHLRSMEEQQDALPLFFNKPVRGYTFWYAEGAWPHHNPSYTWKCTKKQLLAKDRAYTSRIIALELMALYCEEHGE